MEGSGSAAAAEDEDNMELAAAAVAAVAIADEDVIGWMGANGGGSMTLDRFGGHWRLAGPGHWTVWTQLQIEISEFRSFVVVCWRLVLLVYVFTDFKKYGSTVQLI